MTVVVLDTNELQRDWLCKGLKYQLLAHGGFYPPLEVCVPAVVVEELVANHAREVDRLSGIICASSVKLERLGISSETKLVTNFDYRDYLLTRFDEVLAVDVLPWPTASHEELVHRAVTRTPPFNDHGGGYRDSLVWSDVIALAGAGRDVALVTNDRVFADGERLAQILQAEVADLSGSVELVRDFSAWLVEHLPWKVARLDEAVELSRDAEFCEWLMQSDFLYEMDPSIEVLGFSPAPHSVTIDSVEWGGDILRLGSRVSPDGETLVEYDITEEVYFEAELQEGASIQQGWQVLAGRSSGRVVVSGTIPMIAHVAVLYGADEWYVDDLSWRRADHTKPPY